MGIFSNFDKFRLQKIMMTNLDPYLIIKYGNQELYTTAA